MTVVSAVEHTIAIFAQPDAPNEVGLYGVINLDTAEVTNYRVAAVDTTG